MAELWLARHGQTDWNLEKRYQGQTDIGLNDTGHGQARELAQVLEGKQFDAIYSSDLKRARQTAELVSLHMGVKLFLDPRLREASFGRWEGETYHEIKSRYPELWEQRKHDPTSFVAPGGETLPQIAVRMSEAATAISEAFPKGRVLVVSHGLSLAVLICHAQNIPLNQAFFKIQDNACPEVLVWPRD
jgi:alpha-ribazole phosphatase